MENLSGFAAISLKGHDTGRKYVIIKAASADFVLCCDGKYRKLDNPKLKRLKHIKLIERVSLTEETKDSDLRKILKNIGDR